MTEINPVDPTSFNHRFVELPSGRQYHTVDQPPTSGAEDAPVVLMCHGFPDLWYGWRYREPYLPLATLSPQTTPNRRTVPFVRTAEIAAFVEQGWRCIVPSQLGYHETDKPTDPAEYTYKVWRDVARRKGSRGCPVAPARASVC